MSVTMLDLLRVEHLQVCNISSIRRKAFSGVSTDSRTTLPGNLFVALRGESFDGHRFVSEAFRSGAICAVVDDRADVSVFNGRPHVVVRDTVQCLGKLAGVHRSKFNIPFVVIGGSNGKTTTKEMVASVLNTRFNVLSTQGNLNNHIGVPLTLFRLHRRHEVAVIEVGMNHPGELKYLCDIVQPTHGLITNVGREHMEFLVDLQGVADAEGEVFEALGNRGTGFVNVDDALVVSKAGRLRKKVTYGFKRTASVHGRSLRLDAEARASFSVKTRRRAAFEIQLKMVGKNSAENALAATAVGLTFKVPVSAIRRALGKFTAVGKRMETIRVDGVTIINDTYNANPESVQSALETLEAMECPGKKIVILGDMLELGSVSPVEHQQIGMAVGRLGFEYLLTYGSMAKHIHDSADVRIKYHYDQQNVLAEYAAELVSPGDAVLVKGSRGMKMENVVTFLQERIGEMKP